MIFIIVTDDKEATMKKTLAALLTALFLWLTSPTGSHLIARLELTTNEHPEQEMEMIDL